MVIVFVLIGGTLLLYMTEALPLELTSFAAICALLVIFHVYPVTDLDGQSILTPSVLLAGFASPALLTVLALLVLGEGLARTGVLDNVAVTVQRMAKGKAIVALSMVLIIVLTVSALLNNIPVVVIFVPIMQALCVQSGRSPSRFMMPLSFAAILGGMTTLIGSSTNILVSTELVELGETGFSFFSFTLPGLVVAGAGMLYVLFIAPRLLPESAGSTAQDIASGKQFKAGITVQAGSRFEGMTPVSGFFAEIPGVTVLAVYRGRDQFLPPYDDIELAAGDVLIVAAPRDDLRETVKDDPTALHPRLLFQTDGNEDEPGRWVGGGQMLAEAIIKPGSRMSGRTLRQIGFRHVHNCVVVGVERRSRMSRTPIQDVPLEGGDILLIQGRRADIEALRGDPEVILMEWSSETLIEPYHAKRAAGIFAGVVIAAGTGVVPTEIAALSGAAAMVLFGALTLDDAIRALDTKVVFLIAAALSLGAAMHETGGASFLSDILLAVLGQSSPAVVLSGFFLLVAVLANILSTKATAVLFTPIAVAVAHKLEIPVEPFAVAVVFAANCSFASPVGYQTNLIVMGPGGYRFQDFMRVGIPLLLICWLAFSFFAPWYYGL